jgi:hypothetical protein
MQSVAYQDVSDIPLVVDQVVASHIQQEHIHVGHQLVDHKHQEQEPLVALQQNEHVEAWLQDNRDWDHSKG